MTAYPLTWLADVLRDAGCRVVEVPGWKTRGRDGAFAPRAIMVHHDASPKGETSNGYRVIVSGRPGLSGPLSQLWLAYDGTWHVIAAGRANHGGVGGPWGVVAVDCANRDCIGIESDHTSDELWTASQRSEGVKGIAALCRRLGIAPGEVARTVLAHKEYAPKRKIDPHPLTMSVARANLVRFMNGDIDDGDSAGDGEGEDPVQMIQKATTMERTLVQDEWRDLRFSTDASPTGLYAMAKGPLSWFELSVQIYAEGPAGALFYIRPYKDGGDTDLAYFSQRSFQIQSHGVLFADLSQGGSLAEDKWLRVQGRARDVDVVVTSTRGQLAGWEATS